MIINIYTIYFVFNRKIEERRRFVFSESINKIRSDFVRGSDQSGIRVLKQTIIFNVDSLFNVAK